MPPTGFASSCRPAGRLALFDPASLPRSCVSSRPLSLAKTHQATSKTARSGPPARDLSREKCKPATSHRNPPVNGDSGRVAGFQKPAGGVIFSDTPKQDGWPVFIFGQVAGFQGSPMRQAQSSSVPLNSYAQEYTQPRGHTHGLSSVPQHFTKSDSGPCPPAPPVPMGGAVDPGSQPNRQMRKTRYRMAAG